MKYAKLENGKYIEVSGNGVKKKVLDELGFIPLTKFEGTLEPGQFLVIERQGDVCVEVPYIESFMLAIENDSNPKVPLTVLLDFLKANFPDRLVVTTENRVTQSKWTIPLSDRARIRKMIWDTYRTWSNEYLNSLPFDINRDDVLNKMLFPTLQLVTDAGKVVSDAEWASVRDEIPVRLSYCRTQLKDKLIPANTTDNEADAEDLKSKITFIARWVMKQTIPT